MSAPRPGIRQLPLGLCVLAFLAGACVLSPSPDLPGAENDSGIDVGVGGTTAAGSGGTTGSGGAADCAADPAAPPVVACGGSVGAGGNGGSAGATP